MDFSVLSQVVAKELCEGAQGMFSNRGVALPDLDCARKLLFSMREIIFPRLSRNEKSLEERLFEVMVLLTQECVLCYLAKGESVERAQEKGENATKAFFGTLPDIREKLACDLRATYEGDPAASGVEEIVLAYPGFFAIMTNRVAHELHIQGVPLLPRMMSEYAHTVTGIDIHPGAQLGKYLCIDHGTGVVIGESAVIGERVKIYQGVTLGALSTRKGQGLRGKKRHPTIEDGVIIYSNASILGGETVIGHDSVIGGSVFLTSSVPPYSRLTAKSIISEDTEGSVT